MNKQKIKVSCVMPVYNTEEYLHRTIRSLLDQQFQDFELICVDDKSDDMSLAICLDFQQKDDRVHVIRSEKHQGAANCRNLGLQYTKGKYVIFLDSDDIFYPEMLSVCYETAETKQADLVVFGSKFKIMKQNTAGQLYEEQTIFKVNNYQEIDYQDTNLHTLQCVQNVPWNKFVKKELLQKNNIVFQDLPNANDVYYAMITTLCARKIIILDQILIEREFGRKNSLTSIREYTMNYSISAHAKVYWYISEYCNNRKVTPSIYLNYVLRWLMYYFSDKNVPMKAKQSTLQQIFENPKIYEMFNKNCDNLKLHIIRRDFIHAILDKQDVTKNNNIYIYSVNFIRELKQNNKIIALWGCGLLGKKFIDVMEIANVKIDYVVDKDPEKQNTYYKSYCIVDYSKVKDDIDVILILNPKFYEEIVQETDGKELILLDADTI